MLTLSSSLTEPDGTLLIGCAFQTTHLFCGYRALQPRTECPREYLAVPSPKLSGGSPLQYLPPNRPSLLRSMENPHRRNEPHHFYRPQTLAQSSIFIELLILDSFFPIFRDTKKSPILSRSGSYPLTKRRIGF